MIIRLCPRALSILPRDTYQKLGSVSEHNEEDEDLIHEQIERLTWLSRTAVSKFVVLRVGYFLVSKLPPVQTCEGPLDFSRCCWQETYYLISESDWRYYQEACQAAHAEELQELRAVAKGLAIPVRWDWARTYIERWWAGHRYLVERNLKETYAKASLQPVS